jgi:hypothetical protein
VLWDLGVLLCDFICHNTFSGVFLVMKMSSFVQVRANAVRALGNLARFIQFDGGNNDATRLSLYDVGPLNSQGGEKKQISETYPWLEKVVQTLVSCVTTGNVKVGCLLIHEQSFLDVWIC